MTDDVRADCHCGAIVLELPRAPTEITECNCSICRRYGVLWAYYDPSEITIRAPDGAMDRYAWDDRSIDFVRCRTCGCVTHWRANGDREGIGINARLLPPDVVSAARRRHLDGAVTEEYLD